MDPIAWDFIHQYAAGMMPLPNVESSLCAHLGNQYVDGDWQPVLKAVMESEDNNTALNAVLTLRTAASSCSGIKICIPALPTATEPTPKPQQLMLVELEVMESVHHLKEQNQIFGRFPSVDELIEPPKERELPEPILDGSVKVIADAVWWETAAANGEVIDVDDSDGDNDDDDEDSAALPRSKLIRLCKELKAGCMHYAGDPQFSLNLSSYLIEFRACLQWEEFLTAKQTTLDTFFTH